VHGYRASSDQIGWAAPVYVSDTDAKAREEAGPHIETLFNKLLRLPFEQLFPPGYLSAATIKNMRTHKRTITAGAFTIDQLIELGIFLCGSPDTVRRKLADSHRLLGFQNFLGLMQFATLPHALTERSLRLFAAEVMPALQALTDKEYAGMRSAAAE
jgi:alkanesulfonate monooxygenase SsuD/methylene tetrahydromethanopterin reductase-like flavin-dependent oxidoreductase (luciferase family)